MPPQASYSDSELARVWRASLDPAGIGLAEAIAADIAAFTREPVEAVLRRMESGLHDFKAQWEQANVDTTDAGAVTAFYRDQIVEAYELAQWHSGRTTGELPLNYARAAMLARETGAQRILDFGSGIGSGSLLLADTGAEVHSADIARNLLQLTGSRMARRGFTPHLIDLNSDARPERNYYDLITCFDVLEHVPDQLVKVKELASYLRRGGRLLVNFVEDSTHPDRPMHISSAGNWLRLVRKTAVCPDWAASDKVGFPVVVRRPLARLRNLAALALHGE